MVFRWAHVAFTCSAANASSSKKIWELGPTKAECVPGLDESDIYSTVELHSLILTTMGQTSGHTCRQRLAESLFSPIASSVRRSALRHTLQQVIPKLSNRLISRRIGELHLVDGFRDILWDVSIDCKVLPIENSRIWLHAISVTLTRNTALPGIRTIICSRDASDLQQSPMAVSSSLDLEL